MIAACYTELASRLHKTGSTYLYLYLTVGEFPAFVMGLCALVSSCLSGAVNARAWSLYFDSVLDGFLSNLTVTYITEWNTGPPIARYPDFVAVVVVIILTVVASLGVNFSTKFSAIFVVINVSVLILVTCFGIIFGHLENWTRNGLETFFPFGWAATLKAAAVCFWAFSGFELISCAVEESQNPKHSIPIATVLAMLTVTLLYISTTAALSLMVPYSLLSATTPLVTVFVDIGVPWGQYAVFVGTLCAFTTTILSSFYGFIRIALAMAEDGLLCAWFGYVNSYTKVPLWSAIFCGVAQSVIAFCLDIKDLIEFTVNLLLLSYCAVCASVIIISYSPQRNVDTVVCDYLSMTENYNSNRAVDVPPDNKFQLINELSVQNDIQERERYACSFLTDERTVKNCMSEDAITMEFDVNDAEVAYGNPSRAETVQLLWSYFKCLDPFIICKNGRCVIFALGMMSLLMLGLSLCITYALRPLEDGKWWSIMVLTLITLGVLTFLGVICVHKQPYKQTILKLHCIPLLPSSGLLLCMILLVLNASKSSWIGCAVLLVVALMFYSAYSVHYSKLNQRTSWTLIADCENTDDRSLLVENSDSEEEVTPNNS